MSKPIIFITGNPNKAALAAHYLQTKVEHRAVDLDELQSLDLAEIIEHKTREAYRIVGEPVLVDDVSLVFPALGKLPGPFIKWFLKELGDEGICRLLDNYDDKTAIAEVLYGYYDGEHVRTYRGTMRGTIATHPRGDNGFGWTACFVPEGHAKTYEMTDEEQTAVAMQGSALQKLNADLFAKA